MGCITNRKKRVKKNKICPIRTFPSPDQTASLFEVSKKMLLAQFYCCMWTSDANRDNQNMNSEVLICPKASRDLIDNVS